MRGKAGGANKDLATGSFAFPNDALGALKGAVGRGDGEKMFEPKGIQHLGTGPHFFFVGDRADQNGDAHLFPLPFASLFADIAAVKRAFKVNFFRCLVGGGLGCGQIRAKGRDS